MNPDSIPFRNELFEQFSDAVIVIDNDYTVTYLNSAAERQYGVTASEIVGRGLTEMHRYEWLDEAAETEAMAALNRQGYWRGENVHVTRDGRRLHVESSVTRLLAPDGSPVGMIAVIRDVTERRRTEEALRASEERYRTLFESIGEGFCVLEVIFATAESPADLIFVDVNPAFERQTGLEQVVGKSVRETLPELEEYWFENYAEVARSGEPMRFENEARPLNRFYEVYTFRVGPAEQRRVGVIFNDISERKRAEEGQKERDRLQAIVRGQEEERRRLARDLHDGLGQQFTALRLKLDALGRAGRRIEPAEIESIFELAEAIDTGLDRLARDLRPAALDDLGLSSALEHYIREWSARTGINAEMLPSNTLAGRIPAEVETTLYRIVQEALHNVEKHAGARRVDVILQRSDGHLRLVIADDGRGFEPDSDGRDGALGLTSMRERAALINGDLHIDSSRSGGSSVHISVPLPDLSETRQ